MAYVAPKGKGIVDSDLVICDAQAIPTDASADDLEHVVNLGVAAPQLGQGKRALLQVEVTTSFGVSANTPTLTITIVTDDNASLSSDTAIEDVLTIASSATKGDVFLVGLPVTAENAYEKYVGGTMIASSTEFTAGAISAHIVFD